jgi:hypothetical protein
MAKKRIPEVAEAFGEEIDEFAEDAPDTVSEPAPVAPVAPASAPLSITAEQIQGMVASAVTAAITASQSGNSEMARMVTDGLAQSRKPIPEKPDADYHRISARNPLGERDHPLPGLKCKFFLGTRMPKTDAVQRTYPFEADDLNAYEQVALNTLSPASATIHLLDEKAVKVEVVAASRDDITGEITRMVLVVPPYVIEKKSQTKNMLPSICKMVAQITGHDYSKLSNNDLAWFMAQHRAKNYVAVREAVAA